MASNALKRALNLTGEEITGEIREQLAQLLTGERALFLKSNAEMTTGELAVYVGSLARQLDYAATELEKASRLETTPEARATVHAFLASALAHLVQARE